MFVTSNVRAKLAPTAGRAEWKMNMPWSAAGCWGSA